MCQKVAPDFVLISLMDSLSNSILFPNINKYKNSLLFTSTIGPINRQEEEDMIQSQFDNIIEDRKVSFLAIGLLWLSGIHS